MAAAKTLISGSLHTLAASQMHPSKSEFLIGTIPSVATTTGCLTDHGFFHSLPTATSPLQAQSPFVRFVRNTLLTAGWGAGGWCPRLRVRLLLDRFSIRLKVCYTPSLKTPSLERQVCRLNVLYSCWAGGGDEVVSFYHRGSSFYRRTSTVMLICDNDHVS
jgi:hypothetical protein